MIALSRNPTHGAVAVQGRGKTSKGVKDEEVPPFPIMNFLPTHKRINAQLICSLMKPRDDMPNDKQDETKTTQTITERKGISSDANSSLLTPEAYSFLPSYF